MMNLLFQWSVRTMGSVTIVFFLYLNVALYKGSSCTTDSKRSDLWKQLQFLKHVLHEEQAGEQAQDLYPEGFMFIHSLYALAWCDQVNGLPAESAHYQEAIQEVDYCLQKMDSPESKVIFSPLTPLEYGAFYRGWMAYVRGRYVQLGGHDSLVISQFQADCSSIAKAIEGTDKPYLESYQGLIWPADNIVCLAALSLHDRMLKPRFSSTREKWLKRIKNSLIPDIQLIPHGYDPSGDRPLEGARGSSQALMLAFLPEIDSAFSKIQYLQFRRCFLDYRFGLPGIREYPTGVFGKGDIDSGPVWMGIGGVASIVGARAAALHGDRAVSQGLRCGTGALLFPITQGNEKNHLLGKLPVLDAFIAWANAKNGAAEVSDSGHWRWKFQLISCLLMAFLVWAIWKTSKRKP